MLLADFKEKKYCELKEEALNRNLLGTRFGRGYGPVATDCCRNEQTKISHTVLTCTIFVFTLHVSLVSIGTVPRLTFPT